MKYWKINRNFQSEYVANSYRQAIMLSPRTSLYHYNLGEVLLKLGKTNYAINAYCYAVYLNLKSTL
ncbi:hypothetical protein [Okeania sp. SIO1I7]|uniref:hypothetical protein n=1 Tax=Okeania sp. SIO1I7 TaxID=2607772 RepID=UPI0013F8BF45|nr:hypothetical protein [Okeania sp. SIO1I7]NET28270.1 hypothetical protein [Okeania sp. SIO1I7]